MCNGNLEKLVFVKCRRSNCPSLLFSYFEHSMFYATYSHLLLAGCIANGAISPPRGLLAGGDGTPACASKIACLLA